ncbi:MAG: DNA helicase II [Arsenophonus sp.]
MINMNISDLLKNLNDKQRKAVSAPRMNILILAGAGSGKTRVLIYRIAWLLEVNKVSPLSIMAVTFTNKSANEMRHRINTLLNTDQDSILIGTFHGLAHRLLRAHYLDANLPKDFQILDSDDQYRLVRKIIKGINLDESRWTARQAIWYINTKKNEGLRPKYIKNYSNSTEAIFLRIYESYQETCDRFGLVDFGELLLRANELWLNKPYILRCYRDRFTNILIDEFQDINSIQYSWIRILAGDIGKVMIVGDDDQSIYGWRGAQVENIQRFLQDFPEVETIRLEQNYRSTNNILKSANKLISNNNDRLGKNLWTEEIDGEPISLYCASDELDEARYVVNCIKKWNKKGGALKQCAILYRSNSQSRIIEEALLEASISYRIYGGKRFFERQEIKDSLSYLRLIANRNDDGSFEKVVNRPTRGIGERTLETIRQTANEKQITLWKSCEYLLCEKVLDDRAERAIKRFLKLINGLDKKTIDMPLYVQIDKVIRDSGLWEMYKKKEKSEKSQIRIENLEELVSASRQFNYQKKEKDLMPLEEFLSYASLEYSEEKMKLDQDTVQLMTIHSAKGLEFSLVFIVGMEEGNFPSRISVEKTGGLAEERRLAYVGLTRAMKKLTLTYAESRRVHGKEFFCLPSRFISELQAEYIKEIRSYAPISRSIIYQRIDTIINQNNTVYTIGKQVRHPKFGKGTIINLKGDGNHSCLQVAFQSNKIKWFLAIYAKLELQ